MRKIMRKTIIEMVLGLLAAVSGIYPSRESVARAWGDNYYGQLGDGTQYNRYTPGQVGNLSGIKDVAGGALHSLALKEDGTVWAWGYNYYGQLGDGTQYNRYTPGQVKYLSEVKAIATNGHHSLALKEDGTVWAWGYNASGQLGDGTQINRSKPVRSYVGNVQAIAAGQNHSLAVKTDGTVYTWGYNGFGQLGPRTPTDPENTPRQVSNLNGVKAVAGGERHSLALKTDGTVWAWGSNAQGELGDGTQNNLRKTPGQVSNLSGVKAISAGGGEHSLALKEDGTVWAWGQNDYGQLGDGTGGIGTNRYTPVQVNNLSGVQAIDAGRFHNLALNTDGTVRSWGRNSSGQLGDGTQNNIRKTPVQVSNLGAVKAIAGGYYHSLARAVTEPIIVVNQR